MKRGREGEAGKERALANGQNEPAGKAGLTVLTFLTVCKAFYGIVKAQPQLHAKVSLENMQRILRGKWFFLR